MGFERRRKMQVTVPPSPHADSSALRGPITQVWCGVMTYQRARGGRGSMKERGCDTQRVWGWWGVNYLHLAAMSHGRYSRYLLSTASASHPICLLTRLPFAAPGLFSPSSTMHRLHAISQIAGAAILASLDLIWKLTPILFLPFFSPVVILLPVGLQFKPCRTPIAHPRCRSVFYFSFLTVLFFSFLYLPAFLNLSFCRFHYKSEASAIEPS